MDPDPDLTIVLLGNTGVGKSASGNTILGRAAFESKTSFRPVTTRCSTETGEVFGKRISVIDTPGILETEEQMKTCCQNVLKSSRPCLFLVVLRVGRFTDEEEKKGVDTATRVLGDSGMKNSYLLFTGGDELDSSLPEYILNSKRSSLRDVVKSFEGRYHGFNNKDGGREQVRELLDKSEHLRTFELPGLQSDAVSIVLLGNSGSGKSAAGNKILGQTAFESRSSLKPVTTQIREETRQVFGKKITVIDTPGISGSEEQITTWCQRHLQSSIPCLFLVVVRIGRFTKEDQEAVEAAVRVVGPRRFKNCYLLFTGGDSLKDMSLTVFISEDEESSLSEVVSRFGDRIHQFNNQDSGQEEVRELLQKSAAELMESIKLTDRRIVLIGLCGGGKSSSGNTILGSDQFKTDCGFEPVRTGIVSKSAAVEGRWVTVVDFEGFCSRDTDPDHQLMIINQLSDPGPHVFVFVVRLGRMSREDCILLRSLKEMFECRGHKWAMVLFTHGDQLRGRSIDEMIQSSKLVSELVSMCGQKYCVFDNSHRENRQQVREFLDTVDQIVAENGGGYFTLYRWGRLHWLGHRHRFFHRHRLIDSEDETQTPRPSPLLINFENFVHVSYCLDEFYKQLDEAD